MSRARSLADLANENLLTALLATTRIGIGTTDPTATLEVSGDARVTGIMTVGSSSLTFDGDSNVVNVGTALTLGHTQGIQFHTQNLHSTGFEVNNINASGIVTASSFIGDLTGNADTATALETARNIGGVSFDGTADINLPGVNATGNQDTSGNAAGLSGSPSITVTDITASGNVSIAGTLTYEDVTNVDSVGLITARSGIIATGVVTATSFVGDGSNLTGLQAGYFEKTDVGIHTLSNIGIGTTNPTNAALHVAGRNLSLGGPGYNSSGESNLYLGDYNAPANNTYDPNIRVGTRDEFQFEIESDYGNGTRSNNTFFASPTAVGFNVYGDSNSPGTIFYYNYSRTAADQYLYFSANSKYLWFDGDTGRLGINRSTGSGWSDTLDVNGTARVRSTSQFDAAVTVNSGNLSLLNGNFSANGNTVWHAGNDGSGSGLDADTVDSIEGANICTLDGNQTISGRKVFTSSGSGGSTAGFVIESSAQYHLAMKGSGTGNSPLITFWEGGASTFKCQIGWSSNGYIRLDNNETNDELRIGNTLDYVQGTTSYEVWHEGNDGASSGLDADLLDGQEGSYYLDTSSGAQTKSGNLRLIGTPTSDPGRALTIWQSGTTGIYIRNTQASVGFSLVEEGTSFKIKRTYSANTENEGLTLTGSADLIIYGKVGLGGTNYGTSGQVLTSNGSGSAPTWQNSSGGGSGDITPDSVTVNSISRLDVISTTLSTTTQTAIASIAAATYRSVEFMIQATRGTSYHSIKVLALHDGTTAYNSQYGEIFTVSSLATFDVDISNGNIRLLATGTSATSTTYKVSYTAIVV